MPPIFKSNNTHSEDEFGGFHLFSDLWSYTVPAAISTVPGFILLIVGAALLLNSMRTSPPYRPTLFAGSGLVLISIPTFWMDSIVISAANLLQQKHDDYSNYLFGCGLALIFSTILTVLPLVFAFTCLGVEAVWGAVLGRPKRLRMEDNETEMEIVNGRAVHVLTKSL